MIRDAVPADADAILSTACATPCVGARLGVDWTLLQQNPKVPYRFYMVDESAVLALNTGSAVLAGTPAEPEELALFLAFTDTQQLFSDGWTPPHWRRTAHCRMTRPPSSPLAPTHLEQGDSALPIGFDTYPPPGEVIAVLESGGDTLTPAARERIYADMQIRRNHGCAEIYGIHAPGGAFVSTAGAWAVTPFEAYIACVETHPAHRAKGYAHALMAALCRRFAGTTLTLICHEELCGFYEDMGFSVFDDRGVTAAAPAPL